MKLTGKRLKLLFLLSLPIVFLIWSFMSNTLNSWNSYKFYHDSRYEFVKLTFLKVLNEKNILSSGYVNKSIANTISDLNFTDGEKWVFKYIFLYGGLNSVLSSPYNERTGLEVEDLYIKLIDSTYQSNYVKKYIANDAILKLQLYLTIGADNSQATGLQRHRLAIKDNVLSYVSSYPVVADDYTSLILLNIFINAYQNTIILLRDQVKSDILKCNSALITLQEWDKEKGKFESLDVERISSKYKSIFESKLKELKSSFVIYPVNELNQLCKL